MTKNKTKTLHIRVSEEEYKRILKSFQTVKKLYADSRYSKKPTLSDYMRARILGGD